MLPCLGALTNDYSPLNFWYWITQSCPYCEELFWVLIIIGGIFGMFVTSTKRLTRDSAIYVTLIFSTTLFLTGFIYFFGPPGAWMVAAIVPAILFIGLILYPEDPRLKEKYQDGF